MLNHADIRARLGQAVAHLNAGNAKAAAEMLSPLRAALPHDPSVRFVAGLIDLLEGRAADAEAHFRAVIAGGQIPPQLYPAFARALGAQKKTAEALATYENAVALFPQDAALRAELSGLQQTAMANLAREQASRGRNEEAIALFRQALAANPLDIETHQHLNELLHRTGRADEFLQSYDVAGAARPDATILRLHKGRELLKTGRAAEAHAVFEHALKIAPGDCTARSGLAASLQALGHADAAFSVMEETLRLHPNEPVALVDYGKALLLRDEAARALPHLEKGAALAPEYQSFPALMGLCYRALGDARDEALNRYGELIAAFDLEPPQGFSDMESFNRELDSYLAELQTDKRVYLTQTQRGGSRLFQDVFSGGHDLVDRLRRRIDQALQRYISSLKTEETHPFLRRRQQGFSYNGSWSTRLVDCGYHVNHIHVGWISSAYYVAVPDAASDNETKQGWIKFGEAPEEFGSRFAAQRMIQPMPGRLVLFPSYMWHGTVPFQSTQSRATIAFDVIPR